MMRRLVLAAIANGGYVLIWHACERGSVYFGIVGGLLFSGATVAGLLWQTIIARPDDL